MVFSLFSLLSKLEVKAKRKIKLKREQLSRNQMTN
jgi:hypothetical protein